MQRSEYRKQAREVLHGSWGKVAIVTLVYLLLFVFGPVSIFLFFVCLDVVADTSSVFSVLGDMLYYMADVAMIPLGWSYTVLMLRKFRGEKVGVENLFDGYKNRIAAVFLTMLVLKVCVGIGYIFIIPGIIIDLALAFTPYLIKDRPELNISDNLKESWRLMEKRLMDLFLLDLSFIGWYFLGVLTLGIGLLWVIPYHQAARAAFYNDIIANDSTDAYSKIALNPNNDEITSDSTELQDEYVVMHSNLMKEHH